jgi:hypothetical protein
LRRLWFLWLTVLLRRHGHGAASSRPRQFSWAVGRTSSSLIATCRGRVTM